MLYMVKHKVSTPCRLATIACQSHANHFARVRYTVPFESNQNHMLSTEDSVITMQLLNDNLMLWSSQ